MRAAPALLLGLVVGSPLAAQAGSRLWRPDERVVVTDFSTIEALGVSRDRLYVVTRTGIGIYDRPFDRWELPVTSLDGFPAEPIWVALADPVDRTLWMGTVSGLVKYDPALRLFERIFVPGGVGDLMYDRDDAFSGIYIRGRYGWQFLPRGSEFPIDVSALPPPGRQVRAARVEEVLRDMPHIAARAPQLLTDQSLRRFRFTAAAVAPDNEDVFLGTDGAGLIKVDVMTNAGRMPFGLLASSVGALAVTRDGVWVGPGRTPRRVGFTFVASDLQRYAYEEGPPATGYRFRFAYDLLGDDRSLWAATDAGLWRVEPGGRARRIAAPLIGEAQHVLAVAASANGFWAGTERGLVFVDADEEAMRVDERVRTPILALASARDTVWVGGQLGIGVTWEGAEEIFVTADVAEEPLLQQPIIALAFSGDTLVVALGDRIAWRAPGASWQIERVVSAEIGALTALAVDASGAWVGGTRGFAHYRFAERAFNVYNSAGDLPGAVRDIAAGDRYLWIATDDGLVRFTKEVLAP